MQPGFSPWCPEFILRHKVGRRLVERAGHDLRLGVAEREHLAAAGRAEAAIFIGGCLSFASECRQRPDSIESKSRAAGASAVGAMAEADAQRIA